MERIKLDLVPGGCKPILHASQYDIGRQWWIELLNNGVPYVLQEDDVVEYEIRKGDGLVVTGSIAYIPGATYVILVSTEQMCAIYGSNLGELKISSNGAEIGTGNFILDVEKATTGGEKSKSVIWDLQAQVDDCTQKALENIGAKGLPFNNVDTDLEATNTEDAIKEVDSKVNEKADADSVYTKEQVDQLIDDLPEAMIFKGTLGVGGTIEVLPTASASNDGWTYKVITDGTYAGQSADVGDMFTSNGSEWVLIPAGDEDSYTRQEADEKFALKTSIPTKTSELTNDSDFAEIDDSEASASKVYSSNKVEEIADNKIDKSVEVIDGIVWSNYGSTSYPLGWRVGQYNYQTGASQGSAQLMRLYKLFKADEYDKIRIKPFTGKYIQIAEYNSSSAGTTSFVKGEKFDVDEVAVYEVTKGHYYGISLGYFNDGDAADYITPEYISQIVGTFERTDEFVRQELGQSTNDTMSQKAITDAFAPYAIELNNSKKAGEVKAVVNLASGNELELDFGAFIRKNWRLSFSGEISNFNACKLGFNYKSAGLNPIESQAGVVVEITDTNVIVTKRTKPADTIIYTEILNEAHGLTIADYLQIVLSGTDTNAGKILLECNGSVYQQDISDVEAVYYYKPFINANDCDISNGTLAYTCTDFNKKVLITGDSYTRYVNNRWPYWLHQWGYDQNCIINGHGGAKSVYEGYCSTEHILDIATPKYIFWCLGMNDGSDTDENTPNANWVAGRDALLEYCSQNNCIPVFGTIPNARNSGGVVLHDGKNKWIRNSGYQYVDFAKAVGADANGDWRTGLRQGPTDLHPSEAGAKVLCMQVLADFPQIMIET